MWEFLKDPFEHLVIPLDQWVETALNWIVINFTISGLQPMPFYGTDRGTAVNVNTNGFVFFDSTPGWIRTLSWIAYSGAGLAALGVGPHHIVDLLVGDAVGVEPGLECLASTEALVAIRFLQNSSP